MSKVATSAAELFGEQVPEAIAHHPEKLREIGAVFLFKVAGEGGGTWTVDFVSDPPVCKAEDTGNSQCTIEVRASDFAQVLANPAAAMQLFFQGKLKVSGDVLLASKLQMLMSL
jgi:hypothetical protein